MEIDSLDKRRVLENKNAKQAQGMLRFAPGCVGMYLEAIANDTGLTQDEVKQVLLEDIEAKE